MSIWLKNAGGLPMAQNAATGGVIASDESFSGVMRVGRMRDSKIIAFV